MEEVFNEDDPDKAAEILEEKLNRLVSEQCPVVTIERSSNRVPWCTKEIRELMKERNRVRNRWRIDNRKLCHGN